MGYSDKLEQQLTAWPNISVHPHRFGAREFRCGNAEVGHVHAGGVLDVPFPRPIHDALLQEGLAEQHHWVPDSGWITYRMHRERDLSHALWLMRLSYLRYLLRTVPEPRGVFEDECTSLHLSERFRSLLEPFVLGAKSVRFQELQSANQ